MDTLSLTAALERGRMTRIELATALGVDQSTVYRWMQADSYTGVSPSAVQLSRMAALLRLTDQEARALGRWFAARGEAP